MILPRILTALVGIPVAVVFVHLGGAPYAVLVLGLAAMALHEYATLLFMGGRGVQRVLTVAGGTLLALSVALSPARAGVPAALAPMVLTGLILASALRELLRPRHSLDRAAVSVFGALFIGWTLGHLVLLRELAPHGEALSLVLLTAVWATDTAAYSVGIPFGRHRLAEVVSPKKSWEGAAAGLAGALLAVWGARALCLDWLSPAQILVSGLLIGVLGQASDLSQSLVKRASGMKDSGTLLPGHGGVFDRVDSLLLLAPVYYYFWLFQH
ncbi:MAG: phosphatidate cytidylyltransferase [Elusimicrobiota bacterium]